MATKKELFYLASLAYVLLSFVAVGSNTFSLDKNVRRHPVRTKSIEVCANLSLAQSISTGYPCADTDDLRWRFHYNWIAWQFFSSSRGYDMASYLPVDTLLVSSICLSLSLIPRIKKFKSS